MKTQSFYYDGHYIDSGESQEERNLLDKKAQEECEKLTSWNDVEI